MSANFASALNRLNAVINVDPNVLKNATPDTVDEINAACESVAKLAESLEAVVEVDPELGFENQDDWPYEQLTQQNAAVITAAFEQCDADCSGSLNQSETIRMLSRFKLFKTHDEAIAVMCIIDSNDSGVIELDEILKYLDTIDDLFNNEDVAHVKMGFSGTTWRKQANVVWMMNNGVMIMTVSTVFVGIQYFSFVLVPMTMAYFITFLLGPLMELFNARPLVCCGRVTCPVSQYTDDEAEAKWDGVGPLPDRQANHFPAPSRCCNSLGWSDHQSPLPCPLAKGLQRVGGDIITVFKIPFGIALLLTLFITFFTLFIIVWAVMAQFDSLYADTVFMAQIDAKVESTREYMLTEHKIIIADLEPVDPNSTQTMTLSDIGNTAGPFISVINDVVITLLLSLYMLLTRENTTVEDFAKQQAGLHTMSTMERIELSVSHYIVLKTKLSAFTGITVGAALGMLGVRLWFVFGVLTFLFNYIPNVGSMIAMLLPLPLVIVDESLSTSGKLMAFFIPGMIQMYVGNFLEPQLFGKSLNLTAISVLIALILWGYVWGLCGAILSVPLLGVMKLLLDSADFPLAKILLRIIREDNTIDEAHERLKTPSLGLGSFIPDSILDTHDIGLTTSGDPESKDSISRVDNPMGSQDIESNNPMSEAFDIDTGSPVRSSSDLDESLNKE